MDSLAEGNDCTLPIEVSGATAGEESHAVKFSPKTFWKGSGSPHLAEKPLNRPDFLPIVSSTTLAQSLLKRSNGRGPTRGIDGFVVELHTAGGHNAPPRGWHFEAKDTEEPAYGEKDMVDVKSFAKVAKGLPFWFAGSYGKREKLREVLEGGGNGVQVSTPSSSFISQFEISSTKLKSCYKNCSLNRWGLCSRSHKSREWTLRSSRAFLPS